MSYSFKIKTLGKKDWPDHDEIMLHASFQCLTNFVEEELGHDENGWRYPDETSQEARIYKELIALYTWWAEKRPARVDPLDDESILLPSEQDLFEKMPNGHSKVKKLDPVKYAQYLAAMKESKRLGDEWENEDQTNLMQLFRYRLFLWV